jgi:hypothetical protein
VIDALPEKMVRVEYEVPPTRAIWATWFEDVPEATDHDYRQATLREHPRAKVRKVIRGISRDTARAIAFHDAGDDE